MPWDKDPDKAFPAPHPREPGGLRQDILDEIADHLACAADAEREGDESGNEETAWRRALERFGDPDAMARRLWWDQMKETIMREWIQTGVMIVAAAAVVVGVVFMGVMMARVGTANDAMEAAMQQMAASNEALMQAMAEQRKGSEALLASIASGSAASSGAPALELSDIEIVLRRGSEEGPPAPEVSVILKGKGADDEVMTVQVEPDKDGRARFERLYQGTYELSFQDSVSRMSSSSDITLFAGQGAGEHIIVVPDVEPRAIHVDLDLPGYGRDANQLVLAELRGDWRVDVGSRSLYWRTQADALIGHSGTWRRTEEYTNDNRGSRDEAQEIAHEPLLLAGEINFLNGSILQRHENGSWFSNRRRGEGINADLTLITEDTSGAHYAFVNPSEIIADYGAIARVILAREHGVEDKYETVLNAAATFLPDAVVTGAHGPIEGQNIRWRPGQIFEGQVGNLTVHSDLADSGWDTSNVVLLRIPENAYADPSTGAKAYLALSIKDLKKYEVGRRIDIPPTPAGRATNTATARPRFPVSLRSRGEDIAGNSLTAFAVRAPFDPKALPEYDGAIGSSGISLATDEAPFWRLSGDELSESEKAKVLFLPLPSELLAEGGTPATGILFRWEEVSESYYWEIQFDDLRCWVLTEPISASADGTDDQPLNDIDGRFHYDSIRSRPVELTPAEQ